MEICEVCGSHLNSWRGLQIHRYVKHQLVAQGKTLSDGTYLWECNKCEGNPECNWCYGLDTDRIVDEMKKGAKGQRYYALLKAVLSVRGKEMVDFAKTMRQENGGFSPAGIGVVSLKFGLNFKATAEWLEETSILPSGWYERVMDSRVRLPDGKVYKMRVKYILDAAQKLQPDN